MMQYLEVKTQSQSYKVVVGRDIFERSLQEIFNGSSWDKLFLLVDENVFLHHGDLLLNSLNHFADDVQHLVVPQGESSKTVAFWESTVNFLLTNGVRRNTPLFVAGGGVAGDLGGFVAASVLRGIPLIHIPTTILAMVDSSIGGKTGINHQTGKNLIGAFYQPNMVIADTRFLTSLPRREWINGLSEILKYGAISDASIFNEASIFQAEDYRIIDQEKLISLIYKCIKIKADIVAADEFESGIRAFLNFGHTFAHAIEKACNFDTISHGEAVFLGMLAAQKLSRLTGYSLNENFLEPYKPLYQFRVNPDEVSSEEIYSYMFQDKKRTDKHLKFVLLKEWQSPAVKNVTNKEHIIEAIMLMINEMM
ncbi:MAG: 3-dehydroquinate synthase [Balneolaceae bacterium]|nr:MAG: 3-dehydroquinate synthase [Balneolaceae bacterium]